MHWQSFLSFNHVAMSIFFRTISGEEIAQHIVHNNSALVQVRDLQQLMHLVQNQVNSHGMLEILRSLVVKQVLWMQQLYSSRQCKAHDLFRQICDHLVASVAWHRKPQFIFNFNTTTKQLTGFLT